jgi:hypothetical protein
MEHPSPLMTLVDEAMAKHPGDPAGSWRRLAHEAPARCEDAAQAELEALLRSAEHIALGHLDEADALLALLPAVQARTVTWPALSMPLARVRAAVALRHGQPAALSDLAPAEQVRAHANAALARAHRGDSAGALALLERATDQAAGHDDDPQSTRALAALAHNLAAHLREAPIRTAESIALMVEAATRSRAAWASVGGWLEIERADWHLAMCHATAGQGEDALVHARATVAACEAHGADGFEFCFAWQALAEAALAAGQPALARQARDAMAARQAEVTDPGFAAYAAEQLASIDTRLG